jgi:hypothetical protein
MPVSPIVPVANLAGLKAPVVEVVHYWTGPTGVVSLHHEIPVGSIWGVESDDR